MPNASPQSSLYRLTIPREKYAPERLELGMPMENPPEPPMGPISIRFRGRAEDTGST